MFDRLKNLLQTGKRTVGNLSDRYNPLDTQFRQNVAPQVRNDIVSRVNSVTRPIQQAPRQISNFAVNQARPIQQFAQRQIQRPIVQANLHPIQTIARGIQSQPRMSEMQTAKFKFGITPQNQITTGPIVDKIQSYRPKNVVGGFVADMALRQGFKPEEYRRTQQDIVAVNRGIATPEQTKLAQEAAGYALMDAGTFSVGTKSVSTIKQAAKQIALSKSESFIKNKISQVMGIDASKASKSLIADLTKEVNPQKVADVLNLLKSPAEKAAGYAKFAPAGKGTKSGGLKVPIKPNEVPPISPPNTPMVPKTATQSIVEGVGQGETQRGFVTTVKNSPNASPELKAGVKGTYTPKSNVEFFATADKGIV